MVLKRALWSSNVLKGIQRSSKVFKDPRRSQRSSKVLKGLQRSSKVLKGPQRYSKILKGTVVPVLQLLAISSTGICCEKIVVRTYKTYAYINSCSSCLHRVCIMHVCCGHPLSTPGMFYYRKDERNSLLVVFEAAENRATLVHL